MRLYDIYPLSLANSFSLISQYDLVLYYEGCLFISPTFCSGFSFVVILNAIETIFSMCTAASSITQNKSSKLTYYFNHPSAEQPDIQIKDLMQFQPLGHAFYKKQPTNFGLKADYSLSPNRRCLFGDRQCVSRDTLLSVSD